MIDRSGEARLAPGRLLVLAEAGSLPAGLRSRGCDVVLLSLPAGALEALFDEDAAPGPDDELVTLLRAGHTQTVIARRLRCSLRTVQRRVARLRRAYGVTTTQALVAELGRRGA